MKNIRIIILYVFVVAYSSALAQISDGGSPVSFGKTNINPARLYQLSSPVKNSEFINIQKINKAIYGKAKNLALNVKGNSSVTILPDSSKIWLLKIQSDSAFGYQFIFQNFNLPFGAKLFIYNENQTMVLGAFTNKNNRVDGKLITQCINDKSVIIEYYEPYNVNIPCELVLKDIVYIFKDFLSGSFEVADPGSCHIDVTCPLGAGWDNEVKSVVLILSRYVNVYYAVGTGVLLNKSQNYLNSDKPILLTANHLLDMATSHNSVQSELADWVFLFNHQQPYCNATSVTNTMSTQSVSGSTLLAKDAYLSPNSDYALINLSCTVQDIIPFDVAFAGWDISNTTPNYTVCIHHPGGYPKKISKDNDPPVSVGYQNENNPNTLVDYEDIPGNSSWKVVWDAGQTFNGSSGSPLFNQSHQVIGSLFFGNARCTSFYDPEYEEDFGPGERDIFCKLSTSWSLGNFSNWLGNATSTTSYVPQISNNLVAEFSGNPTSVVYGNSVQFTDLSYNNPTSWSWSFDGGSPSVSSQQNPLVSYISPGIYSVTLTVSNAQGSDTKTKTNYITVTGSMPSNVNFSWTPQNPTTGTIVTFIPTNVPSGYDYNWSFGDGQSSSAFTQATHTYTNGGSYSVTLDLTSVFSYLPNITISKQIYITEIVADSYDAKFITECSPVKKGTTVVFHDISDYPYNSWLFYEWTFEFGTPQEEKTDKYYKDINAYPASSTLTQSHTFNTSGNRLVVLSFLGWEDHWWYGDQYWVKDDCWAGVIVIDCDATCVFNPVTNSFTNSYFDSYSNPPRIWGGTFHINSSANNYINSHNIIISACKEIVLEDGFETGDSDFTAEINNLMNSSCQSGAKMSSSVNDNNNAYSIENTSNFSEKELQENTKRVIGESTPKKIIYDDNFDFDVLPNPFINETSIRFEVKQEKGINIYISSIYNQVVKRIISQSFPVGNYAVLISGKDLSPGIYFVILEYGNKKIVKRLIKI